MRCIKDVVNRRTMFNYVQNKCRIGTGQNENNLRLNRESQDGHDQKQEEIRRVCDYGFKENKLLKHAVVNQVDF